MNKIMQWGKANNMGGRVRVAQEGVNVTVSGTPECLRAYSKFLIDLDNKVFGKTDFKFIDNMP